MLLTQTQIQQVMAQAQTAFPNFTDWQYNNEKNEEYFGFALWGKLILEPEALRSRCFFITLDTYEAQWRGTLTIGQHSYLWSSADVGDAHLLGSENCDSVDEALRQLKAEILKLFRAFSML